MGANSTLVEQVKAKQFDDPSLLKLEEGVLSGKIKNFALDENVKDALKKVRLIQERLITAQSRQKSYSDIRCRDLEFKKGDYVFLKVYPMKGIMRFGRKGKLSPRYRGTYPILERIGLMAYRLELPPELSSVHPFFHVSMLR
uniref:Tf2-1-like SH3-like domain-containing protein n=1 Tax=Nicotiana tabacum TaxID=4097 RepID=A0A1S4A699_TOBAC|nr:PREDICTED: uncharacterized protein LOC107794139 [Nicotiana tabacum]